MNSPEALPAAARLCTQCGLCCNGVMFHLVKLQPRDSAKALAALGMKLKRKHGHHFILQPCPAFQNSQCSLYADRPERCRVFECRQLKRLAAGEAVAKIQEALRRVAQLNELLARAGNTSHKRPLAQRCESALAEPIDPSGDQAAWALRSQLQQASQELDALLDQDFRIESKPTKGPAAHNES
jgi:uncharacterized protein